MSFVGHSFAVAVLAIFTGGAVQAQSFSLTLGDRSLGTLTYAQSSGEATIQSSLDNTPLGVFNGSFSASTTASGTSAQYESASRSSRKTRDIAVGFAGGKVGQTVVSPADEMTVLSDPAVAPAGVIDPVSAFGRFVSANGCPEAFRFYDGRRAILVQPAGQATADGILTCDMGYRVSHGPGHLSPLYIKKASVTLRYDVSGAQSLRQVALSAAGFSLVMNRQ